MMDFTEILQDRVHIDPETDPRLKKLPGLNLLDPDEWIYQDEAYGMQLAYADHLLDHKREAVFATTERSLPACEELRDMVVEFISKHADYQIDGDHITRPDGEVVDMKGDHPLLVARRLVQMDICVLEKKDELEHVLTAAALCFPANWRLSTKIGRVLTQIHVPVPEYTEDIARRVQRMFDMIQIEKPMWRANNLYYRNPNLHQPQREEYDVAFSKDKPYRRVERQTLRKLPKTGAVIFGIHTFIAKHTGV